MPVTVSGGRSGGTVPVKEGNLDADGSEQTVVEYAGLGRLSGYIDLSEMQAGDAVEVKEYGVALTGGAYALHASEQYGGAQALPMLHVSPKPSYVAVKVTLRQFAGVFRSYPNSFTVDA